MDFSTIKTQGIRYCGAKTKLIPRILSLVPRETKTVLDAFSGSTRVAQALKIAGFQVDTNDLAEYSKIFGKCYIEDNTHFNISITKDLVNSLNDAKPIDGWFTEYYGGEPNSGGKKPFQIHNTRKLDGMLGQLATDVNKGTCLEAILLTSIILGLDKVDNTLGHQSAYLRGWSKRSYDNLRAECPRLLSSQFTHKVFQQDAAIISHPYDLVYIDPPYGTNRTDNITSRVRYNSYYHIWNTICKNDKPAVFGKNNRRADSSDKFPGALSVFESTNYDIVFNGIKTLCENLNTKHIIFSYSNKGKVTIPDLTNYFSTKFTLLKTEVIPHKENVQKSLVTDGEFMGDMGQNLEYLFLIKK